MGKVKMFTETGRNQPSKEEVMKESTSFLVAEESRQASDTPSGHYKIAPLHRDDLDFEANTPIVARLSYVPSNKSEIRSYEVQKEEKVQIVKSKNEETRSYSSIDIEKSKTRSTQSTLERKSSTSSSGSSNSSKSSDKSWEII